MFGKAIRRSPNSRSHNTGGGSLCYGNDYGHTQEAGRLDAVAGEESESDAFGDSGDFFGYSRYEELIEAIQSGAMVMDDNGDLMGDYIDSCNIRDGSLCYIVGQWDIR